MCGQREGPELQEKLHQDDLLRQVALLLRCVLRLMLVPSFASVDSSGAPPPPSAPSRPAVSSPRPAPRPRSRAGSSSLAVYQAGGG